MNITLAYADDSNIISAEGKGDKVVTAAADDDDDGVLGLMDKNLLRTVERRQSADGRHRVGYKNIVVLFCD